MSFQIGSYDGRRELVIDPTLSFATYLGGSLGESANGIAVDSSGNSYVVGQTASVNFPTASSQQGNNNGGASDVFVAKLNSSGTALIYATQLGGSGEDIGNGIAVDSTGNAYLT